MKEIGDKIQLARQEVEVVACEKCQHKMVNLDVGQLNRGDLVTLKKEGVRISNPETTDPICITCEYDTYGRRLADWFIKETEEDDGGFFSSSSSDDDDNDSGGSLFGGGGFGGFGGGGFGGGGASAGF